MDSSVFHKNVGILLRLAAKVSKKYDWKLGLVLKRKILLARLEYCLDVGFARDQREGLEAANQMLKQEIARQKKINLMLQAEADGSARENAILREVPDRMFYLVFDPRVCLLGKFENQDKCRDGGWCLNCWQKLAARAREELEAERRREMEDPTASRGVEDEESL